MRKSLKKLKVTGDDRSRSLLVNLILEYQVDILLGHLIRGYDRYIKNTRPGFYNKLWLLHSFDVIPDQLYQSIDCLRKIRNRFAHNLNIDRFSDLDSEMIQEIERVVLKTTYQKEDNDTIGKKITSIEFHAIVGLDSYEPNLRLLGKQIHSKEFKDLLKTEYLKKLKEQNRLVDKYMKEQNIK